LTKIRQFIEHNEDDSWRRSLVCGVFFLPDALVLHIRQMRILMGRCKSSINGSLQQMGYSAQHQAQRLDRTWFPTVPDPRMIGELKKWPIRRKPEAGVSTAVSVEKTVCVPSEHFEVQMPRNVPCPVKWRYKFWDTMRSIPPRQADAPMMWS
jgi:hypothetical protein